MPWGRKQPVVEMLANRAVRLHISPLCRNEAGGTLTRSLISEGSGVVQAGPKPNSPERMVHPPCYHSSQPTTARWLSTPILNHVLLYSDIKFTSMPSRLLPHTMRSRAGNGSVGLASLTSTVGNPNPATDCWHSSSRPREICPKKTHD